jgi:hypothetical protein
MNEETSVSVLGLSVRRPLGDAAPRARAVRPLDPPRAHASGPAPYRVVAVGGRPLAGEGVTTHDLALTGALARGIARSTGHGVDIDAVVLDRSSTTSIARALEGWDLSRVDALVLVLDEHTSGARPVDAALRLHGVVADLRLRMPAASTVTIVLPSSAEGPSATDRSAFAEAVTASAAPLTRVITMPDTRSAAGAAERFAFAGQLIGSDTAASLVEPAVWSDAVEHLDEVQRSAAVRRLGTLDAEWESLFHRVVELAQRGYGARSAAISILDGPHARYLARRNFDDELLPRDETICDVTLRTYGGVIVGDAQQDARFRDLPIVRSGDLRFYAGYRVESPDGEPLGALCVFDSEPRTVRGQDITLLRDLAVIAERRIWERSVGRKSI